ncbi:ATP-binding protein [Actinomadura gamaensis]|uniref:ATP-binding protein n=1 Tax=Actinomadura gamaensis TaxID=1763541 RepID=A0ABV9UD31_9ACTN
MQHQSNVSITAKEWLHGGQALSWRLVFPGRGDQAKPARSFVGSFFAESEREDDAKLIACELISNALLHSRSGDPGGWFGVEVRRGRLMRIAVQDLGGRGVPRPVSSAARPTLAVGGRGLRAVSDLSAGWGVCGTPETGHLVWADVAVNAPSGWACRGGGHEPPVR